jgi:16S rRNA (uracil1498-N3)-methyltransferase
MMAIGYQSLVREVSEEMQRYFVESNQIINDKIEIFGDDAKHINKVMRYQQGDKVICSDNLGRSYIAEILSIYTKQVILRIVEEEISNNEPTVHITLYQGLTKADKMEWIIQKGTEIGISSFVPVEMKYSITKWESDRSNKKIERWRKIAKEAAEQSQRRKIPDIHNAYKFKALIDNITSKHSLTMLAYEKSEHSQGILALMNQHANYNNFGLIIGPEGGVSDEERNIAIEKGVKLINLGPRILRAETAGLVAASGILFFHQQLGES